MNRSRFHIVSRWLAILAVSTALSGCLEGSGGEAKSALTPGDTSPSGPSTQPPPPTNRAPEISGVPPANAEVAKIYTFTPIASDADNDFLEFEIINRPSWAQFSVETGTLNGTPTASDVGQSQDITISVTDGREKRSIGPFRIQITAAGTPAPSNTAPSISGTPGTVADVGVLYSFQPSATDADGDVVTYSISNRPAWTTFSTTTGLLSGTPTTANVGDYANIVVSASDGKTTSSLSAFGINVRGPQNQSPAISGTPITSIQATQAYSFQPAGSDPDGDALTYSITNKPTWAAFNTTTGRLSGTPASTNVGAYSNIVISVSDGRASASLAAFNIGVTAPPNRAPTITGTPPTTARVGTAYTFQPTAADADNDSLGFTIQNRPTWAAFDTATGRLSGTPTATGTSSNIIISVSDGKATASLAAFSIVVSAAANAAPTITGAPPTTARVGSAYTFQPTAADANSDPLGFTIQNRPTWAAFDTATGRLSGTPTATGTSSNIIISVSDGKATASLSAFSIVVSAAPNAAPTISGTPAGAATVGVEYVFQPTASDANGDTLAWSIDNRPTWLAFNTVTGRLSGTPTAAGTASNIIIRVSDGTATASLPAFSIVTTGGAPVTGSATLSWTPPSQNTDGSSLNDLAGFRIVYGTSPGALNQMVQVANPGATSYVVSGLAAGTWYFSLRAYTTNGAESTDSSTVSKTIQ